MEIRLNFEFDSVKKQTYMILNIEALDIKTQNCKNSDIQHNLIKNQSAIIFVI